MRMWMIPPAKMCDKHLLGEHLECHMFVGSLEAGKKLDGYVRKGLVEVHNITARHNHLAKEMEIRGFKHNSSLNFIADERVGEINVIANMRELKRRCKNCKNKMEGNKK